MHGVQLALQAQLATVQFGSKYHDNWMG